MSPSTRKENRYYSNNQTKLPLASRPVIAEKGQSSPAEMDLHAKTLEEVCVFGEKWSSIDRLLMSLRLAALLRWWISQSCALNAGSLARKWRFHDSSLSTLHSSLFSSPNHPSRTKVALMATYLLLSWHERTNVACWCSFHLPADLRRHFLKPVCCLLI